MVIIYDRERGCFPVGEDMVALRPADMQDEYNVTHRLVGPVLSWDKHTGVIETPDATYIPKRNNADTD